jgi:membrane protein
MESISNFFREILNLTKKIVLPGFDGVPLYEAGKFFVSEMMLGTLTTRGAAIAFSFFMAIFPSIIFLFTLIPFIPIDNFQDILLQQLEAVLPREAYMLSKGTIEDIVNIQRGGLLSIGFIFALIFSTNGINAIIDAFNQSSLNHSIRPWWEQRIISFLLVLLLTFLTLIAVSLIFLNNVAFDYLLNVDFFEKDINIIIYELSRWVIIIALFYFSISFIYYFGPAERKKWKFFSAGSSLTTLLVIFFSLGFSYYINNFGQYNKIYGSIGTLLVIMLWLYLISNALLIGFELNASINSAKFHNKK